MKSAFDFLTVASILLLLGIQFTTGKSAEDDIEQRCQQSRDYVEALNKRAETWQAKYYKQIAVMDADERRTLTGALLGELKDYPREGHDGGNENHFQFDDSIQLPKEFDSRRAWPSCAPFINSIRDQGHCGSCWAVASASVLTDRHCIAQAKQGRRLNAKIANNWISEGHILSCSPGAGSCSGAYLNGSWDLMVKNGLTSGTNYLWNSGCKPYPFPPIFAPFHQSNNFSTPACSANCTNANWPLSINRSSYALPRYTYWGFPYTYLHPNVTYEREMMQAIYQGGPIVAQYRVHEDFFNYASGVYIQTGGDLVYGHAVRIIGWGEERMADGTRVKYWLVANSWNTNWGMDGFFKIRRGTNECAIESNAIAFGEPVLRK